MFGPNAFVFPHAPVYHHREDAYSELVDTVERFLQITCDVPKDFTFVPFATGGTGVIEAAIRAVGGNIRVVPYRDDYGKFERRAVQLAAYYRQFNNETRPETEYFVQYETSCAKVREHPVIEKRFVIADCISAFPYYTIPTYADIALCVTGKQLAGIPNMGFMLIRSSSAAALAERLVPDNTESCLNLSWVLAERLNNRAATTPMIGALEHLRTALASFSRDELHARVNTHYQMLSNAFPAEARAFGTLPPVFMLDARYVSQEVARTWSLYPAGDKWYQLFCYTGTTADYENFIKEAQASC